MMASGSRRATAPPRSGAGPSATASARPSSRRPTTSPPRTTAPSRSASNMRFNHLQPPFDRAEVRRAFYPAIVQSDYMIAMNGDDRTRWQDGVGYFCPGMPMATDAGMAALTGQRSVDDAKRALEKAGYKG